jgi:hypothetical protein
MGMIIGRSVTPLKASDIAGRLRRETVRHSDDNSRWKVQNVLGVVMSGLTPLHENGPCGRRRRSAQHIVGLGAFSEQTARLAAMLF